MFWLLNSGIIHDARFSAAQFRHQPVRVILAAYAYASRRDRYLINAQQIAVARVGEVVSMAASMGKVQRDPQTFLPFPPEPDEKEASKLSPEAAATAQELIRRRLLPLSIAAELMPDLEGHRSAAPH